MEKKYFGTDGIRGRVGENLVTADFFLKLGFAVGTFLRESVDYKYPRVVIGKDTRISGYIFESALEAGLLSAGCKVYLVGPMPTPAIAYLTKTFHAGLGIVISASHNPYYDNGVKFFCSQGKKLSDEAEFRIEEILQQDVKMQPSEYLGKAVRITDASGRYIEFCKRSVPNDFNLRGKKVVLDCAHGATYEVAPKVFRELGAKVVTIGAEPNGLNINEDVGSTSIEALQKKVVEEQAYLGIAFDGDGDRVLFVDKFGKTVDGDELAYVIACDQQRTQGECQGVVGTVMTNLGVEVALAKKNIAFARAQVGDRYVKQEMLARGWNIGAESSGHIICSDVTTTGDGVIAALKVIFACIDTGIELHDLCAPITKMPQTMINVPMQDKQAWKKDEVTAAVSKAEETLGNSGRVLLRPSGTEPLLRVMVEGEDSKQVNDLAQSLARQVEAVLT